MSTTNSQENLTNSVATEDPEASNWDENSENVNLNDLDFRDRLRLLQWKYTKAGERLSNYIPLIPHIFDSSFQPHADLNNMEYEHLFDAIREISLRVQTQYAYAKEKFFILHEAKELLIWQLSNLNKYYKLNEGKLNALIPNTASLEKRIEKLRNDIEVYERERLQNAQVYQLKSNNLDSIIEDYAAHYQDLETLMSYSMTFQMETYSTRRKLHAERRLRLRQLKKLATACALDKKVHCKINHSKNVADHITETCSMLNNFLKNEFSSKYNLLDGI